MGAARAMGAAPPAAPSRAPGNFFFRSLFSFLSLWARAPLPLRAPSPSMGVLVGAAAVVVVVWAASRVWRVSSPRGAPPSGSHPHHPACPMAHRLVPDLELKVCGLLELDVCTGQAQHPRVVHSCWLRRETPTLMQLPCRRVARDLSRCSRLGDSPLVGVDPWYASVFFGH